MPNYSYLKDDIVNTIENDSNEFAIDVLLKRHPSIIQFLFI